MAIDDFLNNALSSPIEKFAKVVRDSVFNIFDIINTNKFDPSLLQTGFQFDMGRNVSASAGATLLGNTPIQNTLNIASQEPVGNIIVKKRVFSALKNSNDVKYLDTSEKSLLRATKRLFQIKSFQIATYESLTKFENELVNKKILYVPSILNAIQNAAAFGIFSDNEISVIKNSIFQILNRNFESEDTNFTTWYVNKFDIDINNVGKGVGTIEFTNFTTLNVNNSIGGSGGASVSFEDPYHMMMITNEDIELAIMGTVYDALQPTVSSNFLFKDLLNSIQNRKNDNNVVVAAEAAALSNTFKNVSIDLLNSKTIDTPEIVSYVRSKLRKLYLGKSIIQPTDSLYIYLTSNTIYEDDNNPVGLPLNLDKFGVDESILKQEMYAVTGDKNFDINVYKTIRSLDAFNGACVFSGIVENVEDLFSDGSYTLSISCRNNMWYLEQSFINQEPSLDQSQGFLNDPFTPFKIQFDNFGNIRQKNPDGTSGIQLLNDNINLLSNVNIIHERGKNRGLLVSEQNLYTGTFPGINAKQIHHFPGMVYRWKEGIASFALDINNNNIPGIVSKTKDLVNNVYGFTVTSTPFDNMDVANVISLLVTGLPYNINTFVDNTFATGATSFASGANNTNYNSYFTSFFDIFQKQNKTLGNFKPLVNSSVSIDQVKKLALQKISFNQLDQKIGELEQTITDIKLKLNALPQKLNGPSDPLLDKVKKGLNDELKSLQLERDELILSFNNIDNQINEYSSKQDALGFSREPNERQLQISEYLNRQLYLSQRRIEDVRYNRDNNYFIVGAEYDADLDIQGFKFELRNNNFNYFSNKYDAVLQKAQEAASIIDFEFFCDQSGNIVFRPPRYNKIPLSVYFALFRLKGQSGIDLIPEFIKNMFVDQITNTKQNIVSLNWQILFEIGKDGSDQLISTLNTLLNGASSNILTFLGFDQNTGNFSDGDVLNNFMSFSSSMQVSINKVSEPQNNDTKNILSRDVLQRLAIKYEYTFGSRVLLDNTEFIQTDNNNISISRRKQLFENIKNLASKRNSFVRSLRNQLSNVGISPDSISSKDISSFDDITAATENAINKKKTKLAQEILQMVLSGNIQGFYKPQISPEFASIVEDDTRNFIGRGSGRRFVIRDEVIKSFTLKEQNPDYCRVDVTGYQNLAGDISQVLENKVFWAGAVDYDLWRMYGFKNGPDVVVPFLSDPERQLKPYAVFLLLKQRKKVVQASMSIIGNEYYQIGDVVYIPSRDLIFYVTGISHNFTNGEDFSTSLTLEYGRPPGDYIPTPLDVIGKTLLKQSTANFIVTNRQINPDTYYYPIRSVSVRADSNDNEDTLMYKLLSNGDNQSYLMNALINASTELSKQNTKLVITGFKLGTATDSNLNARVNIVKNWFTHPKRISITGSNDLQFTEFTDFIIDSNKIVTNILDLSKKTTQQNSKSDSSDDIVCSDQISSIKELEKQNNNDIRILNASQYSHELTTNIDDLQFVIEIGIQYLESK